MNKVFNFCFILLFVLLLGYLVDGSVSLFMGKRDYKKLEKNLAQAQNELAQLKDSTQDRGYDYTKVVDIQGIYSKVLEHSQKNQQLIAELKKLKEFSQIVSIQSFSWTFQGNVVDLEINANIVNNSGRYSELFAKYRKFKNNLYDAFSGYTIEMSGLPSDVGLHTDLTKLLVNIRISK
jgi:cell division protein FtsL